MKYTGVRFSLADTISSAKTNTSNKTDTSAVPAKVDASPGDSNINMPGMDGINNASQDTLTQQDKATSQTTPTAANSQLGDTNKLEYESTESPTFPADINPETTTPVPTKKGFKAQLIDRAMGNLLTDNTDRPIDNKPNTEQPQQDPTITEPPTADTPKRPNTKGFDPGNIGTINPALPGAKTLNRWMGNPEGLPEVNLGPKYRSPGSMQATPRSVGSPRASRPNLPKPPKFN